MLEEPALLNPCFSVFPWDLVGGCRCFVPVVLNVQFCRFGGVMGCVMRVSLRRVGVMSGYFVVAFLVMTGGFAMVICRVLMVFRCLVMMLRCLF